MAGVNAMLCMVLLLQDRRGEQYERRARCNMRAARDAIRAPRAMIVAAPPDMRWWDRRGISEMHRYGPDFFHFLSTFAVRSAERIVPVVTTVLPVRSVVDIGCGQGAWLSVWAKTGATIRGLDGSYVDRAGLLIPEAAFQVADLARPIVPGPRFDLAQSLEVAEHLPPARAESFVADLVSLAPFVLFSAAVPGQGGEHHVNERPLEYWRGLFRRHGYVAVDCVRPAVRGDGAVQEWYRCNTLIYADTEHLDALSPEARRHLVPEDQPLANEWPALRRIRQALLRPLPVAIVDVLARYAAGRLARRQNSL